MKANELRIGNLILKDGELMTVSSYTFYNIEKDEEKIIESDYIKSNPVRKNNRKSTNGRHNQYVTVNRKTKLIKHKI